MDAIKRQRAHLTSSTMARIFGEKLGLRVGCQVLGHRVVKYLLGNVRANHQQLRILAYSLRLTLAQLLCELECNSRDHSSD